MLLFFYDEESKLTFSLTGVMCNVVLIFNIVMTADWFF